MQLSRGWEEATVIVERPGPVDPTGPCANVIPKDDKHIVSFPSSKSRIVYSPVQQDDDPRSGMIGVFFCTGTRLFSEKAARRLIKMKRHLDKCNEAPVSNGVVIHDAVLSMS